MVARSDRIAKAGTTNDGNGSYEACPGPSFAGFLRGSARRFAGSTAWRGKHGPWRDGFSTNPDLRRTAIHKGVLGVYGVPPYLEKLHFDLISSVL